MKVKETTMHRSAVKLCFAVLTALAINTASFSTPVEAGSTVIGGKRITCNKGFFQWRSNVPGVGLSIVGSGIILDSGLKRTHRDFQRFVFLHECAHQNNVVSETSADCWAIKRGLFRGYFNKRSIDRVCVALWNTPMGIAHNPGPHRCQQMQQCFAKHSKSIRANRKKRTRSNRAAIQRKRRRIRNRRQ